ncbi:recombination mediator RecR [Dethiobacter alkaliphilus]|uniref:Recombination protein RecR n=1 Tax=Dethiobacter alkaliphilus AHT 1 TaxID=555088 RepID=C0GJ87_DETAL|nr:recombination mediator RecR [Dethiobacter alkaliphilus]EEG76572.1 recombination protein RecR [Dethiobacter alkaliphilus AHT 1]
MIYPEPISRLIESLQKLPGVGPKTAQRFALFLLSLPRDQVVAIARSMVDARDKTRYCRICGNFSDDETCTVCRDKRRDNTVICVVQDSRDVLAMERTREYKGLYHVLGGAISPMDGIGPEQLRMRELLERIKKGRAREVILATNPNVEGEATALYVARVLKPLGLKVTRIAHGLPVGGDLEYADEVTLSRALEGRRDV